MPSVTLTPSKDSRIEQTTPNNNYGSDIRLRVTSYFELVSRNVRTLLEFDLTPLPANAIITSAQLSMYLRTAIWSAARTHLLRRIIETWEENVVTWNTQPPTTTEKEVRVELSIYFPRMQTYDVTPLVQDALATGQTVGISIQDNEEGSPSTQAATFDSKEGETVPVLEITYEIGPEKGFARVHAKET